MRTAKRAFVVVCLLAFSIVAFSVPASAAAGSSQGSADVSALTPERAAELMSNSTDFTGQPLPDIGELNSSNYQNGFLAYVTGNGGSKYYSSSVGSSVVMFDYDNGAGGAARAFASSDSDFVVYYYSTYGDTYSGTWNLDSVSGLYYFIQSGNTNYSVYNVPFFSSLQTGLTAASLYLQYQVGADEQTYRFTVPAGYVAYVQLEEPEQDIDIMATMFQNSALIGTNGSYWPTNATIRDGASYPTAGTQFPISGAQTIRWFKDANGSTNLLGQTKAARSTFHATSNMIEIYNPYHTGSTVGDSAEAATSWLAGDPNPNLVVTVTGLSPDGVRMYSLSDRLDVSSDAPSFIVSGSNDDFTDYVESSNQPPTDPDLSNPVPVISWKTPTGDPTPAPSPGGENEPIQSASIADILSNFLSRFTSLFTEGFDAIRNLSENAQQFVSRLGSLYAWLPPQILGVLTSAIILAIIVGVLKVFL